jgi:cobaltochelatase CobS
MSTSATIEAMRKKMAEDMKTKVRVAPDWTSVIGPDDVLVGAMRASFEDTVKEKKAAPEPAHATPKWPNLLPSEGVSYKELFPEFVPATAQDFKVPVFVDYEYPAWMREYVPKSSDYLAPAELVYNAVLAFARKSVTHVVGHPGTGKSEGLPNLIASRLGLPMFRFALNKKGMMFDDLVGRESIVVQDGHSVTAHKDGLLVKVVQHPTFVLLDEFCRANQEITNGCMSLMERNGKLIVENRTDPVIRRHPDCWVVASDNVKGLGDAADRMVGTELIDGAILDRFDVTLEVDYLPQADLKNLIEQWVPGIPDAIKLSKFAVLVQEAYKKGNLPLSLSPRGIRAIAEYACIHQDYAPAVRKVFLCKLAEESDVACVKENYRTAFGSTL